MRGDLFRLNQDNEVIQNHFKKKKQTNIPSFDNDADEQFEHIKAL